MPLSSPSWPLILPPQLPQPSSSFSTSNASAQIEERKCKRILVVDDDPSTTTALRALLTACGHEVVTAATVAAGLEAVDESIDGVILDLMLPDGDGAEVLRRVRSAGLKTKVCVTTGVSSPAWLDRVAALGADCILRKPIDLSELLDNL